MVKSERDEGDEVLIWARSFLAAVIAGESADGQLLY
jgi:hypothetical protein